MENYDTNKLLKKYFKIYNDGKINLNTNKELAFEYFKESLDLLSELKNNHSEKIYKYKNLLDKTENNSNKYISLTIESSIEIEDNKNNNYDINLLYNNLEIGNINIFKEIKYGQINFKEYINNVNIKGQTILHCAISSGDTTFLKHLFKLGARIDTSNLFGNTLLEYACLQQDPNMIHFLGLYGANMQKHLYFRDGTIKYISYNDSIDINILLKFILSYLNDLSNKKYKENIKIFNKIKFIKNNLNLKENININICTQNNIKEYNYDDLFKGLTLLLHKLPEESALSYLNIISEELNFILSNKLGCPPNKLEIILINLVPFIDYPFNISIDWILSLELKYLILKLIKKKNINSINIKKELIENVWSKYIKPEIIQEDYLGCLISQWIAKIKV